MITAGLDVGSRTIALTMLNGIEIDSCVLDTGVNPLKRSRDLLSGKNYDSLIVTGYGRYLVAKELKADIVSEIKAHAVGAKHLYPDVQTVIDIGGQDSKAIALSSDGIVKKFEMNDRCAAGTGRFLEVMAGTMDVDISEIGNLALRASTKLEINSLCTVFAESEVVSLIARGEEASAIAMALHEAIATRVSGMIRRVGIKQKAIFTGGAALNDFLRHLLEEKLGMDLIVPNSPQVVGALGAAILAKGEDGKQ
jgi:predicted CoA-substrate-specific enzyme activase